MFYTGIIASLLPYLLLIGVFGTLLWNNTFHSPDQTEEDPRIESCSAHHTTGQDIQDAYRFNEFKHYPQSDTPDHHTHDTALLHHCQWSTGSHTPRLCLHQGLPGKLQSGLNRTFSFRGPPLLS
ncbi:MAG: hypothetical protein KGY60_13170 [Bacteroidales bacterium]|nr:hypothetical protein [Bacteroidales bacterium]